MRNFHKIALKRRFVTKICSIGTRTAYQPKYELCNIKWEFNPHDGDENPRWSIPHGDDIYPRHHTLKLDVYSGYIYSARGGVYKGKLSRKELTRLHNDPAFQKVRDEAIRYRSGANKHIRCEKSTFAIELKCYIAK